MQTDVDFVHGVLEQGPATSAEILRRSFAERGCGLTVHSRVADLRRKLEPAGFVIDCRRVSGGGRRAQWRYEIVPQRLFQDSYELDYELAYEPDDPKLVTLRRGY